MDEQEVERGLFLPYTLHTVFGASGSIFLTSMIMTSITIKIEHDSAALHISAHPPTSGVDLDDGTRSY